AKKSASLPEDRIIALDQTLPGWDTSRESRWQEKLVAVSAWQLAHNGQRPSEEASDPEEQDFGIWLRIQRSAARHRTGEWSPEREKALDVYAPGWNVSMSDRWKEKLEDLAQWRIKNPYSFPSTHAKDPKERKLGSWLSAQRVNQKY